MTAGGKDPAVPGMNSRKILQSVLVLVIAAAAISSIVDDTSQRYAEQALKRALTTFAVARALNGVISVAQGTEVAVEPGGVGVILTPGQVLDPVNDLIERFSGVMLIVASSLGLQLVLLKISSWWGLTALLAVFLLGWLIFTWIGKRDDNKYVNGMLRLSLLLIFLRFAIPLVVIFTNLVFSTFMQSEQEAATAALEGTSIEIAEMNAELAAAGYAREPSGRGDAAASGEADPAATAEAGTMAGIWSDIEGVGSRIKRSTQEFSGAVAGWFASMNVSERLTQLKTSAANATEHIITLIAIFVLQTIIFPLAFLWLLLEILKGVAKRSIASLGARAAPR